MKTLYSEEFYKLSNIPDVAVHRLSSAVAVAICLIAGTLRCAAQSGVTAPRLQDLSVVQATNAKTLRMWISTQPGANYLVEYKTELRPGSWLPLIDFPGSGSPEVFSDTIGSGAARFYRALVDARPWIRQQPRSRNVQQGDTVQLDVTATGMLPLVYQWYGPSGVITNDGRISGSTTPHLLISNIGPGDEGNYWVVVTNVYGSTSSIPAGVRITTSLAPRILIDPQGQMLLVGQNLSLWSSANGAQPLIYSWFGPSGLLTDGGRIAGSSTTNLTITSIESADDGNYFMVASNAFGVATSAVAAVRVRLGLPPRFTVHPQSRAVGAGETVNLTVMATGTQPLYYQWYGPAGLLNNGGRVSGVTTTNLVITNVQSSDEGDYFAVVTNQFGMATSAIASVRVR